MFLLLLSQDNNNIHTTTDQAGVNSHTVELSELKTNPVDFLTSSHTHTSVLARALANTHPVLVLV